MASRMFTDIMFKDLPVPQSMIRISIGLKVKFESPLPAHFPSLILLMDDHFTRHLLFNKIFSFLASF